MLNTDRGRGYGPRTGEKKESCEICELVEYIRETSHDNMHVYELVCVAEGQMCDKLNHPLPL